MDILDDDLEWTYDDEANADDAARPGTALTISTSDACTMTYPDFRDTSMFAPDGMRSHAPRASSSTAHFEQMFRSSSCSPLIRSGRIEHHVTDTRQVALVEPETGSSTQSLLTYVSRVDDSP